MDKKIKTDMFVKAMDMAYETRQEAKNSILKYIEIFYNRKRRHPYLGLVSPLDFEYKYNQKTYGKTS